MGGNAIKSLETKRLNKKEFDELYEEIKEKLSKTYGTFSVTRSYRQKESFGDMDIILSTEDFQKLDKVIKDEFSPKEFYNNGSVRTFDYKNFQIDIIAVWPQDYEVAYEYYSWNDLHNFIGRVARKMGFKWGWNGLYAIFDSKKYITDITIESYAEIEISRNIDDILEFLGFDSKRYHRGFDSLEDIFMFVIDGKYFSQEIFLFENLDASNRKRNKKRPNYNKFLQFVKQNNITKTFEFKSRPEYHRLADEIFIESNLVKVIQEEINKVTIKDNIRKKFNGCIVRELTGLDKLDLSIFISEYIRSKDNHTSFILSRSSEEINEDILKFYNQRKDGQTRCINLIKDLFTNSLTNN